MLLTDHEHTVLTTYQGSALECQEIQARLFAGGARWCTACDNVLPTSAFAPNKKMTLGLEPRCRSCVDARRTRSFVKLDAPTRRARFFQRHPNKRPSSTRGPYAKTREKRATDTYINDPLQSDLWLAELP